MPNTNIKRVISGIIDRELESAPKKVLLLVGQRRVGKTWELNRLKKKFPDALYFDFEDISIRDLFSPALNKLESLVGDKKSPRLLLLDEVQYLHPAGSILKLLHDHFPATRIVATGSASFLLLKNIGDSLYGRHLSLTLHPLSFREIVNDADNTNFRIGKYDKLGYKPKIDALLTNMLIYGSLPEVHSEPLTNRKQALLKNYIDSLLFKDIFEIEGIRNPRVFKQLLQLLALQLGKEINPNEIGKQLGINRKTVLEYIYLYEKFQILYILRSYSNNPRKEISKGFKVYFSDLGIRNAVINNFMLPLNRIDMGDLFENQVVNIFRQNTEYFALPYQLYFWRTFSKAEVDLVLHNMENNELIPIEIKYKKTKMPPQSFTTAYRNRINTQFCINTANVWQFI